MAPPTSNKFWDEIYKKDSYPFIVGKMITWNDPHENPYKTHGKLMPLSINGVDIRKILTAQELKYLRPLWCHYYQFDKPGSERLRELLKEDKNTVIVSGEGINPPEVAFEGEDIGYKSYTLYSIQEYDGPVTKPSANIPVNRLITNSRTVQANTSFAAALTMAPPLTPLSSPVVEEVNDISTHVSSSIVEMNEKEDQEIFSDDKEAIIQSLKQQIIEIKQNNDMAISDIINKTEIEINAIKSENIEIKQLNCEMEKKLTVLEEQKETFVHLLEDEKQKLIATENKYKLEITKKIAEAEDILKMTKDLEQRITSLPDKVEGGEKSNKPEPKFSQELFDEGEWEIVTKYGYNDLKRIIRNISFIGQDRVAQQMMEVIPHPTVCFIMEKALQNK